MRFLIYLLPAFAILAAGFQFSGCSHFTYSTVSKSAARDTLNPDPDPDFSRSLDFEFQDFTSYLFMGNRVENFTAYFNKYFQASKDFEEAMDEYRTSFIATYNRRLDSLGVTPPLPSTVKEKLDKTIERASKIIQYHKSSKYIDDAVLTIGKTYFYQTDYINAERKFNEFLQRLSSSELTDEALLFLARTKLKLGKQKEGLDILKSLVKQSKSGEIKSLASRDLGIQAFNSGNLKEAVTSFKNAIKFSDDNDRKAENQFILARLSSAYKPETAAAEFKKVLDYSPDFDLTYFARLNYAKGLIRNRKFSDAEDELSSMRSKYREYKDFTPLIDLEMANNLYARGDLKSALNKYYEVIVKHPNTSASSDAYYFLGRDQEVRKGDYLNALVNYRKATQENSLSEFYPESSERSKTFERYFQLMADINGGVQVTIPDINLEVEKYRQVYNDEQGIEQPESQREGFDRGGMEQDGTQRGDGKGRAGGNIYFAAGDSIEERMKNKSESGEDDPTGAFNPGNVSNQKSKELQQEAEERKLSEDSLNAIAEEKNILEKESKKYNSYYELAELFIYDMNLPDSAEHYLKTLLADFPDPDKRPKTLFMLGTFYKQLGKTELSNESFESIISEYPGTVYGLEAARILNKDIGKSGSQEAVESDLISNALIKLSVGDDAEAVELLNEFLKQFPDDSLSARALYGLGWIYQNRLNNKDSAVFYYTMLKEKFPLSQYYANIAPALELVLAEQSAKNDSLAVNDSLVIQQDVTGGTDVTGSTDVTGGPDANQQVKKEISIQPGAKFSVPELEYLLLKAGIR